MEKLRNLIKKEKWFKNLLTFPPLIEGIIIGVLLGDGNLQKRNKNGGACLRFGQSMKHKEYLLHLYNIFELYCGSDPTIQKKYDKKYDKTYYSLQFQTLIFPYFTELYSVLYINGLKTITVNFASLIQPLSLAYWFMDDGAKISGGYLLHTDGFTLSEVEILREVLSKKFNIDSNLRVRNVQKKQYGIYIGKKSRNDFIKLIEPYLINEMKYKLHDNR